jgi:7 transmembrane sweet-taste receptor of 3 GCPR/Bacterial extracellular solute-binding proteins, family 3
MTPSGAVALAFQALLVLPLGCIAEPFKPILPGTIATVHLRAAIIPTHPFGEVVIEDKDNTTTSDDNMTITGYHMDLVNSLINFALIKNVTLTIDVEPSPFLKYNDAMSLVANDCEHALVNLTNSTNNTDICSRYDIVLGDFYVNSNRADKVNFLPAYIRSSVSTIKRRGPKSQWNNEDYTLLRDAERDNASVCATSGTYAQKLAISKYPNSRWVECGPTMKECIQALKNQTCVLYCADEHKLKAQEVADPDLQVTGETIQRQFFTWPMAYRIHTSIYQLIQQLLFAAIETDTLDDLYYRYFAVKTCPLGNAGEGCQGQCDPDHGLADRFGTCICASSRWTGDDCSQEVLENRNEISSGIVIAGYVMFGINVVVCLVCSIFLWIQRGHTQVVMSQPFFLAMVLVGCLISSSTILPIVRQQDSAGMVNFEPLDATCMAVPWLYSMGFSITFGTLFAKLRRVYIIFSSAMNMRRVQVTITETVLCIAGLVLTDGIILTVWTIIDPLRYERQLITSDTLGHPLESVGLCTSDQWQIFAGIIAILHFGLLLMGCWYCYLARHLPDEFSDAKYVVVAMISNAQIFVIAVPVLLIVASTNPGTSAFVRSIVIFMNDLAVVLLIFGNLMYKVFHAKNNNNETAKEAVASAMVRYRSGRNMSNLSMDNDSGHERSSRSTRFSMLARDVSMPGRGKGNDQLVCMEEDSREWVESSGRKLSRNDPKQSSCLSLDSSCRSSAEAEGKSTATLSPLPECSSHHEVDVDKSSYNTS